MTHSIAQTWLRRTVVCLLTLSPITFPLIHADPYNWDNSAGGIFNTAGNWDPEGPPIAGDNALFELENTYTVTFGSGVTNNRLFIGAGNVTFDLTSGPNPEDQYTYALTTTAFAVADRSLNVHSSTDDPIASLIVEGGILSVQHSGTAGEAGSHGQMLVTGSKAEYHHGRTLHVGQNGSGTFTIQNGAKLIGGSISFLAVAWDPSGDGELVVTGAGTEWTMPADRITDIGRRSTGKVIVEDSAQATIGTFDMGSGSGGNGTLSIRDSGASVSSSVMNAGLNSTSQAVVTVSAGADFSSTEVYIGKVANTNASILITGTGTDWSATGGTAEAFYVGGQSATTFGGNGTLTVADGAVVTVSGDTVATILPSGVLQGDGRLNATAGVLNHGGTVRVGLPAAISLIDGAAFGLSESVGTLTIGGNFSQDTLVLNDTSYLPTLQFRIADSSNYDQLNVLGSITLGDGLGSGGGLLEVLEFGVASIAVNDQFQILQWDDLGSLTGTFDTISLFELSEGLEWDTSQLYTTGIISVIPEPGHFALAIGALIAAGLLRRRR